MGGQNRNRLEGTRAVKLHIAAESRAERKGQDARCAIEQEWRGPLEDAVAVDMHDGDSSALKENTGRGKIFIRIDIRGLKEEHKEIFYFLFLRQFSPQYLALMRGQTDRNIRKVRDTVLRKIHKKMVKQLRAMQENGYSPSDREQRFLQEWRAATDNDEEGQLDDEHL